VTSLPTAYVSRGGRDRESSLLDRDRRVVLDVKAQDVTLDVRPVGRAVRRGPVEIHVGAAVVEVGRI